MTPIEEEAASIGGRRVRRTVGRSFGQAVGQLNREVGQRVIRLLAVTLVRRDCLVWFWIRLLRSAR